MITIDTETYVNTAHNLLAAIGRSNFFNGSVTCDRHEFYCTLRTTLLVYRKSERLPEGERAVIRDIVPVWWEFHTETTFGEELNDFSFDTLKEYLY